MKRERPIAGGAPPAQPDSMSPSIVERKAYLERIRQRKIKLLTALGDLMRRVEELKGLEDQIELELKHLLQPTYPNQMPRKRGVRWGRF